MNTKKKILVIDDDPEICEALTEILTENNYEVLTALNTEDGLRLLENERPDLLILDIMMATMYEGLDFATEIRKREGIWGIPIMIVSARPPAERGYSRTIDEDMDWIHADIFMEKPVDPDDLIHNVRLLLK
ncbi:MAG: hypothetical protein DRG59_07745 [Deltaproteobacteria bacterium]|nr:MAG: hypothetical protein DRG59_07745 [Deltaproteobacteria bacterium]HEC32135.1 response regulator [Deltaproteobacteria bacterium]